MSIFEHITPFVGETTEKNERKRTLIVALLEKLVTFKLESSLIQELMKLDEAREQSSREQYVQNVRKTIAKILARLHNNLQFEGLGRKLFQEEDIQKEYERLDEQGLSTLSEQELVFATTLINRAEKAEKLCEQLKPLAQERLEKAQLEKNVADYFMWLDVLTWLTPIDVITRAMYDHDMKDDIPTLSAFITGIESKKERFVLEAAAFKKAVHVLQQLPDEGYPRFAAVRASQELDSHKPVRVVSYFPPGTFHDYGGQALGTNAQAVAYYFGIGAPLCVLHGLDTLYQLTRKQTERGFEPQAFSLRGHELTGVEPDSKIPEEYQRYLSVVFKGGRELIPPGVQAFRLQYPELVYTTTGEITNTYLQDIVVGEDGVAHFVLGIDEDGNNITQNAIVYAAKSLLGGYSNARNIDVTAFTTSE